MPETIRAANERLRSRPRRGGFLAAFVIASFTIALAAPADAGSALGVADAVQSAATAIAHYNTGALALTLGLVCFAVLATIALLRSRRQAERLESMSGNEAMLLHAEIDRLKALLLAEPQVLVEWPAASDQPEILGDTSIVLPGAVPERVLAFGTWLEAPAAQRMERAVDILRSEGRGFVMTLTSAAGRPVEAEGRAVAGRAVLRLRDISGIEQRAHRPRRAP